MTKLKLEYGKLGFKGELGELQIYFKNILLHQQKFLVVLFLSN